MLLNGRAVNTALLCWRKIMKKVERKSRDIWVICSSPLKHPPLLPMSLIFSAKARRFWRKVLVPKCQSAIHWGWFKDDSWSHFQWACKCWQTALSACMRLAVAFKSGPDAGQKYCSRLPTILLRYSPQWTGMLHLLPTPTTPRLKSHVQLWTVLKLQNITNIENTTKSQCFTRTIRQREDSRKHYAFVQTKWIFNPWDGFSKVLFPISAKNRIPCVTPLVLLVKKVILKIQVKCIKMQ